MKKHLFKIAIPLSVALSLTCTSCIGSFTMFHKLTAWNETVGRKAVNEIVFVAFWIIPVYEVALLSDLVVLNSIEFWSGENPAAKGTRKIDTDNGRYLVKCDGKGYDIISVNDGSKVRLDFCASDNSWSIVDEGGVSHLLFAYVDDNHVRVPLPGGESMIAEVSAQGLLAYKNAMSPCFMAVR